MAVVRSCIEAFRNKSRQHNLFLFLFLDTEINKLMSGNSIFVSLGSKIKLMLLF